MIALALAVVLAQRPIEPDTGPLRRVEGLELVRPSEDGSDFVGAESGRTVKLWGVNYDHDGDGRLLEDYWAEEWPTVVADFREIRELGANVVRIHLQVGRFLDAPDRPDAENLERLGRLIRLAEAEGLYLDLTGLGCYHKADVPDWYNALDEPGRWGAQANFWRSVAKVAADSPAVFCYDLMNEPILPGEGGESEWLGGEFAGKSFVQRIALNLDGRDREAVAKAWVETLVGAIREVDDRHMVTIGVIPWALTFPGAKPLFHGPEVGRSLDFVSVHFYPKSGEIAKALEALQVYELGKPLVVEECFPLASSAEELGEFIDRASDRVDGWISFYWGRSIAENEAKGDLSGAIVAGWLREFQARSPFRTPETGPKPSQYPR